MNCWFFTPTFSFLFSFIIVLIRDKLIKLAAIQHCEQRSICNVQCNQRKTGTDFVFLVLFNMLKQLIFTVCTMKTFVKSNSKHSMKDYS